MASTARKTIASKGHLNASKSHYKHQKGWPNLLDKIDKDIKDPTFKYYVIASFSTSSKISATHFKPGQEIGLKRVIDESRPWSKSGDYWLEKIPNNGKDWRFDFAVKSAWNNNKAFVGLPKVPTIQDLEKLNIPYPKNWSGMKVWKGVAAEQYDLANEVGSKLLLPGGGKQIWIDFSHPDNEPVKLYIDKMIEIQKTNWNDAILPKDINSTVAYLEARERSNKTVHQGQVARNVSSTGRANTKHEQNKAN